MNDPRLRTFTLRPASLQGWLALAVGIALFALLAVLFFSVLIVLVPVGLVTGWYLQWRARRRMRRMAQRPVSAPGRGKVIDAEYEVHPPKEE